jgi:hypothetical protein
MIQGSGFGVQGSGFRVQGSGFRVQGSGFRVQGVQNSGLSVQGTTYPSVFPAGPCAVEKYSGHVARYPR